MTLKSDTITYRAQMQTTDPAVAIQYREFSDWYTQFNLALNPSSRPPFPRMMLNAAIERHQGVAKEVHLSAAASPQGAAVKITSRHQLAMQLDSGDLNRVAEVGGFVLSFRNVLLREYQGK